MATKAELQDIQTKLNVIKEQASKLPGAVPVAQPEPPKADTAADVYGSLYSITPEEKQATDIRKSIEADYAAVPSESDIRTKALSDIQSQIDALNAAAAAKKAEIATQLGEKGRQETAQASAIGARRGLLGSTFQAGTEAGIGQETTKDILAAQNLIDTETQDKISALRGEAMKFSNEEYNNRLKAYREGRSAILTDLSTRAARRTDKANAIALAALNQGLDLSDIKNASAVLAGQPDTGGLTPEMLAESYRSQQRIRTQEEEATALKTRQAEAEIASKGLITAGKNETVYRFNPDTNKYEVIARGVGEISTQPSVELSKEMEATIGFLQSSQGLSKDQTNGLRLAIAVKGEQGLKDWAYDNMLSSTRQGEYDKAENASNLYDAALRLIEQSGVNAGPKKAIAEQVKTWVNIQKDPQYSALMAVIESGQAGQRNALFGSALSGQEAAKADAFFVQKNDDIETVKRKIKLNAGVAKFNNDKIIARSLGLPAPKFEDYVNVNELYGESQPQTSSGNKFKEL